MRTMISVVLLFAAFSVAAGDTTRIGNKIVTVGMTAADARSRAGTPIYADDIVNHFGAKVGENWSYQDGRRSIVLTISGGKVTAISETLL